MFLPRVDDDGTSLLVMLWYMLLNSAKLGDEYVTKSSTAACHGFTAFSTQVGSYHTTNDDTYIIVAHTVSHWLHGILCSLQNSQMNFTVSSLKFPSMQTSGAVLRSSANCNIYLPIKWIRETFVLLTYIVGFNFPNDVRVTNSTVHFSNMILN